MRRKNIIISWKNYGKVLPHGSRLKKILPSSIRKFAGKIG
jgi:hypothetical protein